MKDKVAYLLLIAAVIASGCVGGSSNSQLYSLNDGVVIKDFSFDTAVLYDDDLTTMSLTIQNVGAKPVPGDIAIFVYGPPITTEDVDGKWKAINYEGFDVKDGFLSAYLTSEQLLPPDPEMNVEGDARMFYIDLEPPNVPDGMSETHNFFARVCFPYNTSAVAYFTAISRNEIRYEPVKQSEIETINSAGPIHITVVGSQNVRAELERVPIEIEITNVGGGFPTKPSEDCRADIDVRKRGMVKLKVEVDGEDVTSSCSNGGVARLRNGRGTVRCYYKMEEGAPKVTHRVVVTASYKYYVDAQTAIEVRDSTTD